MTLTSTELALTTARYGVARYGVTRYGYAPAHTVDKATVGSTTGPHEPWTRVYPPDVAWTRVST